MIDLSAFGLGILALLAVWKFVLRPSIQDAFKDSLFDVRDNMRRHFAAHGQINTRAYQELRDTLNGYIRFIEVANLALTYRFASQMADQPKVAELYLKELDRRFDVTSPELARVARSSRKRCSKVIQIYLFHSSLFSVAAIYLVFVPMGLTRGILVFCRERASHSWKSLWLNANKYVQAKEDMTIEPYHTELFSQMDSLQMA